MTAACIALMALALAWGGWFAFRKESARINDHIENFLDREGL